MFVEEKYRVQVRDTKKGTQATNRAFLGFMEDVASIHSSQVGFGVYDIPKTNLTWILLGWKLKVISRPQCEDIITAKTWSRGTKKYYAYRDFEIRDTNGKLLAVATSKWILIDTKKHKVTKVTDSIAEKFKSEPNKVFENEEDTKLKAPENYISTFDYKILRRDIDLYNHVHNLNYLDLAYETLPEDVYNSEEPKNLQIAYRREMKLGEEIKCMYQHENGKHIIVIKSKDNKVLHSIIEMW